MKVFRKVVLALLGLSLVLVGWGATEPYTIDEQMLEVDLPNLPAELEGERVAVMADLQVGMWLDNTLTIKRMVQKVVAEQPAAVLIAGDFVYHASKKQDSLISEVVALLQPLTNAGIPTYAVLGNHDYAMPTAKATKNEELAQALISALENASIRVLQNEAVALPSAQQQSLYIVGVGSYIADEADPEAALAQLPPDAPRLVFMHHPDTFEAFSAETAPLAVSGHTHGGQFRLPFTPSWTWMTYARDDEIHADGFIKDYGEAGNRLYINRGIGFSVVPLRLNCRPELTFFTLAPS